jgi:lipopolysaccharide transport system permease protein
MVIEAGRSERHYWLDWVLAWRDLSVRYKQPVIGVLRAPIRPFLTLVAFCRHFPPHGQAAVGVGIK